MKKKNLYADITVINLDSEDIVTSSPNSFGVLSQRQELDDIGGFYGDVLDDYEDKDLIW